MIPHDLPAEVISLPAVENPRLVLITGYSVGDRYLGQVCSAHWGERLAGWYAIDPTLEPPAEHWRTRLSRKLKKLGRWLLSDLLRQRLRRAWKSGGLRHCLRAGLHHQQHKRESAAAQNRLLKPWRGQSLTADLEPELFDSLDSETLRDRIHMNQPYLIITAGVALAQTPLLQIATAGGVHLHQGSIPKYCGSNSLDWALFHRRLEHLGCTVHLLSGGNRPGPLLARSATAVQRNDTGPMIQLRTLLLGTDCLMDAVDQICAQPEKVTHYRPLRGTGQTYGNDDMVTGIEETVHRDLKADLLPTLLHWQQTF